MDLDSSKSDLNQTNATDIKDHGSLDGSSTLTDYNVLPVTLLILEDT